MRNLKIKTKGYNLNSNTVILPTIVIDKSKRKITFTIGWIKWAYDFDFIII